MATQAGIGVLIGVAIGVGITYFLMQRTIRRQNNAIQQALSRANRLQDDHAREMKATLAKMESNYEQQLAAKIERYQDTHEEQLTSLEAEYEARIAALTNVDLREIPEDAVSAPATPPPDPQPAAAPFSPIPDPWVEASRRPAPGPAVPTARPDAPDAPDAPQPDTTYPNKQAQAATGLGKAAATSRKIAVRVVPQLGKLIKDSDADVRLAAVTGLQESGSIKAIPFLRQALRDSDSRVVAAASSALSRFKGTKKPTPKAIKKKRRR
ncbi:MAG: HEAT repeat domain-containing protein [Cyanobacteria bacterium P01_A01_bin.15]